MHTFIMQSPLLKIISFTAFLHLAACDQLLVRQRSSDVGVTFSDKVKSINAAEVGSTLVAASGVAPEKPLKWTGLVSESPFYYPKKVHLLVVETSGVVTRPATPWRMYQVTGGPVDVDRIYHTLLDTVIVQQPQLQHASLESESEKPLPDLMKRLKDKQLLETDRRSLVLLRMRAPAGSTDVNDLIPEKHLEEYSKLLGADSLLAVLVTSATQQQTDDAPEDAEDDRQQDGSHERVRRAAPGPAAALNLALFVSPDFPVVFNIILFTSLFLVFILVSFSMMMAYMDPGRDSIIYRVTNPNKKSN